MLSPSPFRWKHWIKKRETTKWVVLAVLGQSKKSRGNVGNAITATVPPAHKERAAITFCRLTDFGWPRGEGKHYILHKYGQQAREHGRSRFARTAAESETRAATRPLPNVADRDSVRSDYYHLICYYTPDRPLLPPSSINSWSTPCARWLMFLLFIYLLLLLLYIIIIIFFIAFFFLHIRPLNAHPPLLVAATIRTLFSLCPPPIHCPCHPNFRVISLHMCRRITRRRLVRARTVVSEWPFVCSNYHSVEAVLYRVPTPPIVRCIIDNSFFDGVFFFYTNSIVSSSYLPFPSLLPRAVSSIYPKPTDVRNSSAIRARYQVKYDQWKCGV